MSFAHLPRFMTLHEAAAFLRVPVDALAVAVQAGAVPACSVGDDLLVDTDGLLALMGAPIERSGV